MGDQGELGWDGMGVGVGVGVSERMSALKLHSDLHTPSRSASPTPTFDIHRHWLAVERPKGEMSNGKNVENKNIENQNKSVR